MSSCLSLLCFMVFGPPGLVLGSGPQPAPAAVSVQGYGAGNGCPAWTDGCVTCRRAAGGAAHCSTPGIACTPRAITCTPGAAAP